MINWSGMPVGPHEEPASAIGVTVSSWSGLLDDLDRRLQEREGFCVATLNLDHVVKIRRNPLFRDAYARHTHVTADGNPIVWLSRLAGHEVELIPGSEQIRPVLKRAAARDTPVVFFGSTVSTLQAAAERLCAEIEGLRIVDCIAPPEGFDPDSTAAEPYIQSLQQTGAGLVILALGAPKQEVFAVRAAQALPKVGFLSVGAGLDFIAGTQRRAPRLFQALAAEWLWRLLSNPARLAGRYARCFAILPALTREALNARRALRAGESDA